MSKKKSNPKSKAKPKKKVDLTLLKLPTYNEKNPPKPGSMFKCPKTGDVYRYVDNALYTGIYKLQEAVSDVPVGIMSINVTKIPSDVMKLIVDFFGDMYTKHGGESALLLWYNPIKKDWELEIPSQIVSIAGVDYTRDPKDDKLLRSKGYVLAGTVHSHGKMPAFHSSTDDDDEYTFDGIHITIGNFERFKNQTFSCRFIMKDTQYKMKLEEITDYANPGTKYPKSWLKKVGKRKPKKVKLPNPSKVYAQNLIPFEDNIENPHRTSILEDLPDDDDDFDIPSDKAKYLGLVR